MKRVRFVLIILIGLLLSFRATAGTISAELMEAMMGAQSNEALFIGHVFGVDNDTTLYFDYNFNPDSDPNTRSFSYLLRPGQSFLEIPIELTVSGYFDESLNRYEWDSIGSYGSQSWTSFGFVEWIGDPKGTVDTTVTLGGVDYKVTGEVEWEQGPINATSKGSYTFKAPGGQTYGPYKGTDQWKILDQKWEHTVTVPKNPVTPDGIVTFFTANIVPTPNEVANFSMKISAVPEPNTIVLFSLGLLSFVGVSRRKK